MTMDNGTTDHDEAGPVCLRDSKSLNRYVWDLVWGILNLQNRFRSVISEIEPAAVLAMRGSPTTTAKHLA